MMRTAAALTLTLALALAGRSLVAQGGAIRPLLAKDLAAGTGREVTMVTVESAPGASSKDTSDGLEHPTSDEIARLAYHFYERRGRGTDRDLDDWLAAEWQLNHHYR